MLLDVAKFRAIRHMGVTDKRDEIIGQIAINFKEALDDEARRTKWESKIGSISQNRSGCKEEDD